MATSEEPTPDTWMDISEGYETSQRQKGKLKKLKETDPDDYVPLAQLVVRGKESLKQRTSQKVAINLAPSNVKRTPTPKTPLKTDTVVSSLKIEKKKAATSIHPQLTLSTERVTKYKKDATKRKAEQESIKISKGKAKKTLQYTPMPEEQEEQPVHKKQKQQPAKDKEIICNNTFDDMDNTAREYNVNLRILKLWYGQLHGAGSMQSMVFIAKDEKGSCRQGFIPIGLAEHWKSILNEGSTYAISRAYIADSNNYVKLIDHKRQLTFTEKTSSILLPDTNIPLELLYNLQKLDTIQQIENDKEIKLPKEPTTGILKEYYLLS